MVLVRQRFYRSNRFFVAGLHLGLNPVGRFRSVLLAMVLVTFHPDFQGRVCSVAKLIYHFIGNLLGSRFDLL